LPRRGDDYDPNGGQHESGGSRQAEGGAKKTFDVAMRSRRVAFYAFDQLGNEGEPPMDSIKIDLGEVRHQVSFGRIVGTSPALRRVLEQIEMVSRTDSTVIIEGETGTGKELLAQAVHDLSRRRSGPFTRLNCAAIPTGLLESELFGHEKGAFTGAFAQRAGRFERANGGTIFLDEVGEIPLELQPKFLRVLQEREFERLGGTRTMRTDTRVVAATNRNLETMVARGTFRPDLFYRLNVFPIRVPALRERPEDIPLLVRHFSNELSRRMNKSIDVIPPSTMTELCRYPWPGNIRELQNVVERAVILSHGPVLEIDTAELKLHQPPPRRADTGVRAMGLRYVRDALQQDRRDEILRALREADGRVGGLNGAAARLGLKRTTLIARMKKLGVGAHPRDGQSVHRSCQTDVSKNIAS